MSRISSTTKPSGYTPGSIDSLNDVDTTTTSPTRDYVLKWNGSNWVPAVYNATFAMTLDSFSCGQTSVQQIGVGVWKAVGAITFSMTYTNPPPASGTISMAGNSYPWSVPITLSTPWTSDTNDESVYYPSSRGASITFTAIAWDGSTPRTRTSAVMFQNNLKYGPTTISEGWVSENITGLTSTYLMPVSTSHYGTFSTTCGGGQYILFAYPASYSTVPSNGFKYNGVTCPFTTYTTVSVTNSGGYTENYKVFRSSGTSLGSSNLVTTATNDTLNHIRWGSCPSAGGPYTNLIVTGFTVSGYVASNTKNRQIFMTGLTSEYILYALPYRLGTVTFQLVGSPVGGFESPETVEIININGYKENYRVYRSTYSGLGVVEINIV